MSNIIEKDIRHEMKESVKNYTMYVIEDRAISNIEDNQKPSSLSILYSMYTLGVMPGGPFVKSARIVGDVIGKYHPHGDMGTYGALVQMTRDFSKNIPYIVPNGNFGSISDSSAAAYRYCCAGDTMIKTKEYGDITLKELAEKNGLYKFGEKPIDINLASVHGKVAHASKIIHSGDWPIYRLELMNGNYLEGTENHPVLVVDSLSYKWKRLDEITDKDIVVLDATHHEYIEDKDDDVAEARFLGAMISEGCITTQNRVCINNTEFEMVDCVRRYVKTNEDANIVTRTLKSGKTIYEFMFCNKELHEKLRTHFNFGNKSNERDIPKWLRYKSKRYICIFLKYLFEGDGSVALTDSKRRIADRKPEVTYWSSSKKLVINIVTLLAELGITSKVYHGVKDGIPFSKLYINGYLDLKKFYDQIGFLSEVKSNKLKESLDRFTWNSNIHVPFNSIDTMTGAERVTLSSINNESSFNMWREVYERTISYFNFIKELYSTMKIVKVKRCIKTDRIEPVYSVRVDDESHAFVTNGVISHNTECRLSWYTRDIILKDLAKGVVEYRPNFDDTLEYPLYFPEVLPDVLINGNIGIASAYSTFILPHNLGDVINLCIAYVKDRNITPEQMYDVIKGPDFPLGGIINGTDGLKRLYTSGDGYVRLRGEYTVEEDKKGYSRVVITSLPYTVTIPTLTEEIGRLVDNKDINIKDLRDETSQQLGVRLCIDLQRDESVNRVISTLISKTSFERTLKPKNNILKNKKFKEKANIKDIMSSFVDFRETCLHNKFLIDLKKNEDRLHILEGLFIVTKDIDKAVKIIRNAKDTTTARDELMKAFKLSEPQAQYILDLKLARLTKLNMSDAREEEKEVKERIKTLTKLTRTKSNKDVDEYMIKEWEDIRNIKEAKPYLTRKTKIQKKRDDVTEEDTIPDEPCTIIMTQKGYIKRTEPLDKEQKRGGKGNSVGTLLEGDEIKQVLNVTARQQLVFLTSKGRVYTKKAYEIDSVSKLARGALARNLLGLRDTENIVLVFVNDNEFGTLISCSVKGMVKSTDLKNLKKINSNGKNLIGVDNSDKIVDIVIIPDSSKERDILIATHNGMCIRIDSNEIKPTGIGAVGVTGIKLDKEDKDFVSSMCRIEGKTPVIFVTESGYIKRCNPDEFKVQNRNGVGVKCTQTKHNNRIVAMVRKEEDESILIYTKLGKSLVCDTSTIKLVSRSALGVKGIDLQANDIVIGVS